MTIKTSITTSLLAASALFMAAGMAQATTVGFNSIADCTSSDFTISSPGVNGNCSLQASPTGSSALVQSNIDSDPLTFPGGESYWEVAFNGTVSNVSIDLGDFNADQDHLFLWAWDAADNVIGSFEIDISNSFVGMLNLDLGTLSGIASIVFGTVDSSDPGNGGLGRGGIYADNLTYTVDVPSVPVPAALPLLLTGLGALGAAGWRRKRNAA